MRCLYGIIYFIGFAVAFPYWLIRSLLDNKYTNNFKARLLGPGKLLPKQKGRPRIWLWALSLGEVLAAKNLGLALEESGAEVIISSTTKAGLQAAQSTWPGRLILSPPFDFSLSTRRFVKAVKPDMLVLVETDIWPGILYRLTDYKIPKVLVSARISPRSLKRYKYIKSFWGSVLHLFDLISTQSEDDRQNLISLGAQADKTVVIGDLKFDHAPVESGPALRSKILEETGWPEGRWLVAGSVHAGEEVMILNVFEKLLKQYADLKLLLAPRNKVDFEMVWQLLQNRGLAAAHRLHPDSSDKEKQVFLLDTLGELERFYELGEIAMVGKSWPGHHQGGGHNPLEPALRRTPVIFGPLTHNFRWMTKALVECGGGLMVPDEDGLYNALNDLLQNPEKGQDMGHKAYDFVMSHQGSVAQTMEQIKPILAARLASINH